MSTAAADPGVDDMEVAGEVSKFSYGQAGLQGPRDTMEDFTSVIANGRCGFMIACAQPGTCILYPPAALRVHSHGALLNIVDS